MKCWCGGAVIAELSGPNPGLKCSASKYHDWESDGRPKHIQKIYVAGPMSGYPECNYPAFNAATSALRETGFEVVNPAEFGDVGSHYVDLIRMDLRVMLDCHAVATLENWWESVGARNEVQVAGILRMPVRSVSDWLQLGPS